MSLYSIKEKLFRKRYEIGFAPFNERIVTEGRGLRTRYVKNPPKDKWYADPFLLDVTEDRFVILVEEKRYKQPIGRIAKLEVNKRTMRISSEQILLDLPEHLSFPNWIRINGELYVYPENAKSGSLNLYHYVPGKEKLELHSCLVQAPLSDAVIFETGNVYYLFATDYSENVGSGHSLKIYKSNRFDGDYCLFQEVTFSSFIARNAGSVLLIGNQLYRVAQDCSESYGKSILFQKVVINEEGFFSFENVSKIEPSGLQYGTHTFNVCKDWAVVDVNVAVHPLIRRIWFGLAKLMKR